MGGRKFIGLLVIVIAGIAVDIFAPHGLSSNLAALLGTMYGLFATGNAVATWATAAAPATAPPASEVVPTATTTQTVVDFSPVQGQLDTLTQNAKTQSDALAYVVDFVAKVQANNGNTKN